MKPRPRSGRPEAAPAKWATGSRAREVGNRKPRPRSGRPHIAFYEAGSCQGEFGLIGSPFYSSFHGGELSS